MPSLARQTPAGTKPPPKAAQHQPQTYCTSLARAGCPPWAGSQPRELLLVWHRSFGGDGMAWVCPVQGGNRASPLPRCPANRKHLGGGVAWEASPCTAVRTAGPPILTFQPDLPPWGLLFQAQWPRGIPRNLCVCTRPVWTF